MSFLEPVRLWLLLLIPLLVLLYVLLQLRKSHYAVRFTNLALLDTVAPRRVNWRQHVAVSLAMVTLGFGIVLFAQPSKVVTIQVPVQVRLPVVLTMDVSLSMGATDVKPSRIASAQRTAKQFIDELPARFEAGLVTFSREADVVVPPTQDNERVKQAIDELTLDEYTATGEGIYSALDVIEQATDGVRRRGGEDVPLGVIVLLGDGAQTVGRSDLQAARDAGDMNVPIYTVSLGTEDATIISEGQEIPVPAAVDELRQIAELSGGEAYVAESPEELLDAYRSLTQLVAYEERTERRDATSDYVGYLVILALVSTAAGLFVATRWP
jgi:Ca-activated chloride channel family protein